MIKKAVLGPERGVIFATKRAEIVGSVYVRAVYIYKPYHPAL